VHRASGESLPQYEGIFPVGTWCSEFPIRGMDAKMYELHTCTIGMIVKVIVQTLPRKGI
jgi:hypothetical protein